jgi:hypothetical protein
MVRYVVAALAAWFATAQTTTPVHAGGTMEWGSIGHEMCHDLSRIVNAKTPDELRAAAAEKTDFPCSKNLPVRTFLCHPASDSEAKAYGMTTERQRRVVPFSIKADPSDARLFVGKELISTTDVLLDTPNDWQGISVTTPWNGNSNIRDTPFDLSKTTTDGVWIFWDHLEGYICSVK